MPNSIKPVNLNCSEHGEFFAYSNSNLEYIGGSAFESSTVKKVIFNDGVTVKEVGKAAFYRCQKLNEFDFTRIIDKIQPNAFGYCKELSVVETSDTLTLIGFEAFSSAILDTVHLNSKKLWYNICMEKIK